jgi:hypothetical protein
MALLYPQVLGLCALKVLQITFRNRVRTSYKTRSVSIIKTNQRICTKFGQALKILYFILEESVIISNSNQISKLDLDYSMTALQKHFQAVTRLSS